MRFKGIITELSEVKSGTTKNGNEWSSINVEVTESEPNNPDYPQIGMFSFFKQGEHKGVVDEFQSKNPIGTEVDVEFNLKRQEYTKDGEQKKFYKTEAWKINKSDATQEPNTGSSFDEVASTNDDLPF